MNIETKRFFETDDTTIGFLGINGQPVMFTLEDEHRETKVMHETRIPAGTYALKLRKHGRFHERYKSRYPDFHRGMLELVGVPGFTNILIHAGNDDDDTSGCLLVGWTACLKTSKILASGNAYAWLYQQIIKVIDTEEVTITIYDRM